MGKKRKRTRHKEETKNTNSPILGIAWYRREQWNRLLTISSDHNELENTYDEWLKVAESQLSLLIHQGYTIRKVNIDVEELLRWCNSQFRSVDGEARSEFTTIKLQESDKIGK